LVVLSMLCHSLSTSVLSAANSSAQRPRLAHRSKRLNTVFHGPNSSGRSRQGTPVRRHHTTASKNRRSLSPGRPRPRRALKTAWTRAHCSSLIHDRVAIPSFDHTRDPRTTPFGRKSSSGAYANLGTGPSLGRVFKVDARQIAARMVQLLAARRLKTAGVLAVRRGFWAEEAPKDAPLWRARCPWRL
jgi:hypothetical protein